MFDHTRYGCYECLTTLDMVVMNFQPHYYGRYECSTTLDIVVMNVQPH